MQLWLLKLNARHRPRDRARGLAAARRTPPSSAENSRDWPRGDLVEPQAAAAGHVESSRRGSAATSCSIALRESSRTPGRRRASPDRCRRRSATATAECIAPRAANLTAASGPAPSHRRAREASRRAGRHRPQAPNRLRLRADRHPPASTESPPPAAPPAPPASRHARRQATNRADLGRRPAGRRARPTRRG